MNPPRSHGPASHSAGAVPDDMVRRISRHPAAEPDQKCARKLRLRLASTARQERARLSEQLVEMRSDLPDGVPVTSAELEAIESYLAGLLDELFDFPGTAPDL